VLGESFPEGLQLKEGINARELSQQVLDVRVGHDRFILPEWFFGNP
jgi:hypothetical protein